MVLIVVMPFTKIVSLHHWKKSKYIIRIHSIHSIGYYFIAVILKLTIDDTAIFSKSKCPECGRKIIARHIIPLYLEDENNSGNFIYFKSFWRYLAISIIFSAVNCLSAISLSRQQTEQSLDELRKFASQQNISKKSNTRIPRLTKIRETTGSISLNRAKQNASFFQMNKNRGSENTGNNRDQIDWTFCLFSIQ